MRSRVLTSIILSGWETGRRYTAPGDAGSRGARLAYKIVNQVTNHPITAGLPKEWLHVPDELYANMRGPGENMTVRGCPTGVAITPDGKRAYVTRANAS